jgi:hypothetical protein
MKSSELSFVALAEDVRSIIGHGGPAFLKGLPGKLGIIGRLGSIMN